MNIKFGIDVILVLIFMVLKLTNYIEWSWFWVFSPVILMLSFRIVLGIYHGYKLETDPIYKLHHLVSDINRQASNRKERD